MGSPPLRAHTSAVIGALTISTSITATKGAMLPPPRQREDHAHGTQGDNANPAAVTTGAPPATSQPASNPLACNVMALAGNGEWAQAETHWLSAEQHATTDYNATMAFYLLVTDSGTVATDQLTGAPSAGDVATYNTDLAAAFTTGC